MHRIASQPGEDPSQNLTLIEQPSAEIIFLTSAESDITTLSNVIKANSNKNWHNYITAINISNLANNAVVDHYISTTCAKAKIVIIRLNYLNVKNYNYFFLYNLNLTEYFSFHNNQVF